MDVSKVKSSVVGMLRGQVRVLGVLGRERIVMGAWPSSHLDGFSAPGQDRVPQGRAWVGKPCGLRGKPSSSARSRVSPLGTADLRAGSFSAWSSWAWGEFRSISDPHPLPQCGNHRCSQVSPSVWLPPPGLPYSLEVEPADEPQAATCTGDRDPSEDVLRVPGAEEGPSVKRQSHKLRGRD